jgi:Lar family restriction alleviation protein
MKEFLLGCPFCGSDEVEIARTNPHACWVECAHCGVGSPCHRHRKAAIRIWNTRASFVSSQATITDDDDATWRAWHRADKPASRK